MWARLGKRVCCGFVSPWGGTSMPWPASAVRACLLNRGKGELCNLAFCASARCGVHSLDLLVHSTSRLPPTAITCLLLTENPTADSRSPITHGNLGSWNWRSTSDAQTGHVRAVQPHNNRLGSARPQQGYLLGSPAEHCGDRCRACVPAMAICQSRVSKLSGCRAVGSLRRGTWRIGSSRCRPKRGRRWMEGQARLPTAAPWILRRSP